MRTTITLDPDVEQLLRQATRASGAPFKQVVNDAIREGLRAGSGADAASREVRFRQRTFGLGRPLVDLSRANALADEISDEALIAKVRARQ